jgi:translocation protein SEC63
VIRICRKVTSILIFAPLAEYSYCEEQRDILLQTPVLLNALLNVSISRNWLMPTLAVMRLHAYVAQAMLPMQGPGTSRLRFAQLPGVNPEEVQIDGGTLAQGAQDFDDFVSMVSDKKDSRADDIKYVASKWGRLDVGEVSFKG